LVDSIPSALTISFQRLADQKITPTDFQSVGNDSISLVIPAFLRRGTGILSQNCAPKRATKIPLRGAEFLKSSASLAMGLHTVTQDKWRTQLPP
jgi:hypothetical protein